MSAARKLEQIGPLPKLRAEELEFRVGAAQPNPSEVGPLYKAAYRTSRTQGLRVATALAKTLPDIDHHRQLFQAVALRPAKERRTLIDGYRKAEQDRWVVHAIGELPVRAGPGADEGLRADRDRQEGHEGAPRGAPLPRGSGGDDRDAPGRGRPERLRDRRAGRGHRRRGQTGGGRGRRRDRECARLDRGGVRRRGQFHRRPDGEPRQGAARSRGTRSSTSSSARSKPRSPTRSRS